MQLTKMSIGNKISPSGEPLRISLFVLYFYRAIIKLANC